MGTGVFPGFTWSKGVLKLIDPTNEEAQLWYTERLKELQNKYSVSLFNFDYGEICYLPGFARTTGNAIISKCD